MGAERTGGNRVRIPTGPAPIGNRPGPVTEAGLVPRAEADAVHPHRRHRHPHSDRPGADR
jgi:hypothetical protein